MQIRQILSAERTFYGVAGGSKKKVLENISQAIDAQVASISADDIYNALLERERLGSTGLGNGIAIPHCRLSDNCPVLIGSLIQLDTPVEFDAVDDKPVDILFVLLVPEDSAEAHLETLSLLASRFMDPQWSESLRRASNAEEMYQLAIAADTAAAS